MAMEYEDEEHIVPGGEVNEASEVGMDLDMGNNIRKMEGIGALCRED